MYGSNPYEGSSSAVRTVLVHKFGGVRVLVSLERVLFLFTHRIFQRFILLSVRQLPDHLINAISLGRGTKRQLLERPSRPLPEGRTGSRGFSPTMKLHPAVAHTL